MEYGPADSSGTDDDLPPAYQNRGVRGGRVAVNGRSSLGSIPYNIVQNDMEAQIHQFEKDAYCSVLRAFQAQADALTWEKEGLITELRKELRVSDDEHRELLGTVNADDIIQRIRQWREAGGGHSGFLHNVPSVPESIYGSTMVSRKKQKVTTPAASLVFDSPMQPCSAVARTGDLLLASKPSRELPAAISRKSSRYPSTASLVTNQIPSQGFQTSLSVTEPSRYSFTDSLIGRKIFVRWHTDNNFYEALISNYDAAQGLHALVYDRGTTKEAIEWVNLQEIPSEDIRWEGHTGFPCASDSMPGLMPPAGQGRAISGNGRGRGIMKIQAKKDHLFVDGNNTQEKGRDDQIILPIAENMIKEVERILNSSNPDRFELEKAKKHLQDHEQLLLTALVKLGDPPDVGVEAIHQGPVEQSQPVGKVEPSAKLSPLGLT